MKRQIAFLFAMLMVASAVKGQIGKRFPSERVVVKDSVTGTMLTFLTRKPMGDSKIYQTHNQWTSDGEWLIFRSNRVPGEAIAVHEKTGEMVQVTEGGYTGMLNIARNSMKLFFMRKPAGESKAMEIVEVDLANLFADSKQGKLKSSANYQRVCGVTPVEWEAGGDMALDANEDWAYFRVGRTEAGKHLAPGTKIADSFGPRKMGAGPNGIGAMNVRTGEVK
jgi:oligogalacturonide lyase